MVRTKTHERLGSGTHRRPAALCQPRRLSWSNGNSLVSILTKASMSDSKRLRMPLRHQWSGCTRC